MPQMTSEARARPGAIFFPPIPPALDTAIPRVVPPGRQTPPEELAEYVADIFYPQLGSRLAERTLNERMRDQLADYRTAKRALLKELRDQIAAAPENDDAARRAAFASLAQRQTPKIAALDQQAEKLRTDLLMPDRHWSAFRQWHLGDKDRRGFSPIEISQTLRGYAHYQKNLPLAVRLLLLEIAVEMRFAAESAEAATANQRHMFFSPTLARVIMPDDMTPEIAAKVAVYQTKKSLLKKDLYEAVLNAERRQLFLVSNPLTTIAEKQTAPIAELETLAEEIRMGLGSLVRYTPVSERSPLPPRLAHRLTELIQSRYQLEKEASAKMGPLLARARRLPVTVTHRFEVDGLRYALIPRIRTVPDDVARQIEILTQEFAEISAYYGQQLAELINRRDDIRREAAELLPDKTPAAVDAALAVAVRSASQIANASHYRDYRLAVVEPGLSPGQRRLLFQASLDDLDVPLPRGEMQPTVRGSSW